MNKLLAIMQLTSAYDQSYNFCFKGMYTTPVFIAYFSRLSFYLPIFCLR